MDAINTLFFRSKIRQRILARFFAGEGKRFYINEMARLAATTQGTCRRELNKLADAGILKISSEGNLRFYEINREYPLYREFRGIVQKTIGIEAIVRNALEKVKGITWSFIFGSYAKEGLKATSDIDIVIIGKVSENSLLRILKDAEKEIGREINYHIYTVDEFRKGLKTSSFLRNIIKGYKVITGDEAGFERVLKEA